MTENKHQSIDPKTRDTAIFFTILHGLALYFLFIRPQHPPFGAWNTKSIALILAIQAVLLLCAKYLRPVFDIVLDITGKIGALMFAVISTIVYYLILTPIGLYRRRSPKSYPETRIDKTRTTYYETWESHQNPEKQY